MSLFFHNRNVEVGDRLIILFGKRAGQYVTFQSLTIDGNIMVEFDDDTHAVFAPHDVELASYLPQVRRLQNGY